MTTIYRATLETINFDFEAFGGTPDHARDALSRGLRVHCKQYNVSYHDLISAFIHEIVVRPIDLGAAYRGSEQLR